MREQRTWVVNASPLILLGKIGQLSLLPALAERVMVPRAVADEIAAGPPDDAALLWLHSSGREWIGDASILDPRIMTWDLGAGETAVISQALVTPGVMILESFTAKSAKISKKTEFRKTEDGTRRVSFLASAFRFQVSSFSSQLFV